MDRAILVMAGGWTELRRQIRSLGCRLQFAVLAVSLLVVPFGLKVADAQDQTTPQTNRWIGSWTASPQAPRGVMPASFSNQTIRQVVRLSIGGNKVKIRLSNEFGTSPLLVGSASVGIARSGGDVVENLPVTFGGLKSITIPPGAPALSDPIELLVAPLSDITVNLYLPETTELATVHRVGQQTAYVSGPGDFTAKSSFPAVEKFDHRFFLTGVMVEPSIPARAIVTFGDSITDGTNSTLDANARWPDIFARRLQDAGIHAAVLNQAISGNRVLSDGAGVSALARFERDVLSLPGVSHVVIFIGINDMGFTGTAIEPFGLVRSADEIIAGYKQLIERARTRSIKVIGSPLAPFENAQAGRPAQGYYTPAKEMTRQAINKWIRTSGAFDGLIDFEKALADPKSPSAMIRQFDSGDHLHPNDAGYRAMAESIDLKMFQ